MVEGTMVEIAQEIEGEADALCAGVNAAVRMLRSAGAVRPITIGLVRESGAWRQMWEMDVAQALMRGEEGLVELGVAVSRLVSAEGCDLSALGFKEEHKRADAVLFVAEVQAAMDSADGKAESWRSVIVELKTANHCCGLVYRVVCGSEQVRMDLVGRVSGEMSPVMRGPRHLH